MQVRVTTDISSYASVEAGIVPIFEDGLLQQPSLPETLQKRLDELQEDIAGGHVPAKKYQVTLVPASGQALLLVGAGKAEEWDAEAARKCVGAAVRNLRSAKRRSAVVVLPGAANATSLAAAACHGAYLANFSTGTYKTEPGDETDIEELVIAVSAGGQDVEAAVQKASVVGEAANLARSLANEPPNVLTPRAAADRAREVAQKAGLEVQVLDETELQARQYGGLLAVASGSVEPARLVCMRYTAGPDAPTIGFIGKGITFDTGGISIKPAQDMHIMKSDMTGSATVLGAMFAIARLKPAVNVVGIMCLAENMPSGSSMRPGDVVRLAGGKLSAEILNTDAEGRLVLADGIAHAISEGAERLVDVATLTGACVVALGRVNTGVFGSDQAWTDAVLAAARHTGEKMWQMPMDQEYREQLRSTIADIANVGGREGGAITAAWFLRECAGDTPLVHLDVAGTSWASKPQPFLGEGPTGVAVATLVQLAEAAGRTSHT